MNELDGSFYLNQTMDERKVLEEQLREAACIGDTDAVQELINLGVDVNARHAINGWTALHWACKRSYLDVVVLLLKSGADRNVKSEKGETPASVSSNPYVLQLLGAAPDFCKSSIDQEAPIFVPNYLKNAPLNAKIDVDYPRERESISNLSISNHIYHEEVVLKIRVAYASDSDFIEVDLPRHALTYENLIKTCCDELDINAAQIVKLRKLPNTKIRRDKDVQRLENYQEIEVVLYTPTNVNIDAAQKSMHYANGSTVPITPTNNYQSISKKDQTILY